jgi:hypothetical protein
MVAPFKTRSNWIQNHAKSDRSDPFLHRFKIAISPALSARAQERATLKTEKLKIFPACPSKIDPRCASVRAKPQRDGIYGGTV